MSRYPDGTFGVALLLLRMCYAFVVFGAAAVLSTAPGPTNLFRLAASVAALCLVIGFATRWIALALGIAVIAALTQSMPNEQLLLAGHIGGCLAIASMGAGAFSLDARLYGRRVIQLPPNPSDRSPDRGSED
jgi:putative oxidoreductase